MSRVYSNYADIIDFTRASNATMVDSDGLIKWAPHNLLKYSEDLTNTWAGGGVTTTSDTLTSDVSTGFHYVQQGVSADAGTYTFSVKVKANGYNYAVIRLVNDNFSSDRYGIAISLIDGTFVDDTEVGSPVTSYSVSSEADGWYRISVSMNHSTGSFFASVSMNDDATPSWSAGLVSFTGDGTSGVYAKEMHLYRSDLGGMVDNPGRGDSYVPTTSSAVYLSRIEYDADGNLLGLLVEEARTNLLTYSEQFDNAAWVNFNAGSLTITTNQSTGSDGLASLDKIEVTDSTLEKHFLYFSNSITQGQNYSISCELKNGNQRYVSLGLYDSGGRWFTAVFDLQTGVVTQESEGGADATIQNSGVVDMGGGLFRCYVVGSVVNGDSIGYTYIQAVSSGTPTFDTQGAESYSATGGEYFYAGKIQLEAGSFPTSYIPTSGSTATRSADVADLSTSAFGYNPSEGTLYGDIVGLVADPDNNPRIASLSDGTNNNRISLLRTSSNDTAGLFFVKDGNFALTGSAAVNDGDFVGKYAGAYKVNDVAAVTKGGVVGVDLTSSAIPVVDRLNIGSSWSSTSFLNGHIKSLKYYPRRLTNAQLQALTS